MEHLGIDDDSLTLAIQLQQEDLELWDKSWKGKHKEGEFPDSDLAFEAYRQELESFQTLISDQTLSLSTARAVEADQSILSALAATDEQSSRDHEYARRLSRNPNARAPPESEPAEDKSKHGCEDDILEQIRAVYAPPPNQEYNEETDTFDFIPNAESSKWAATRPTEECIGCLDQFPLLALTTCSCSHNYCRQCLVTLFLASFKDESLFPPRCCREAIPVESNGRFLSPELVGQYHAKKIEFDTPDRTYCSKPSCSTFVPPRFVQGEVAHCPRCRHKTCSACKGDSHTGVCPSDTGFQQVLRMAEENHWQRCNSCGRVVELAHGCNHMTCQCGSQFCYACGEKWKKCRCAQWDEHRLIARVNNILDRNGPEQPGNRGQRALAIERERQNLLNNHQCNHTGRWARVDGQGECEVCHQTLPHYIHECRQCRTRACRRCMLNRL